MNHTPGPWIRIANSIGVADAEIAKVWTTDDGRQEANARLIAAAPDLLKSLQDIEAYDPNSWAADTARAAIAKAEGRR